MIIFQKSNHMKASIKMIIFRSILLPIFWSHFQAPPVASLRSQSPCNLSTCSLRHQRQRKEWQLPNPSLVHPAPNKPENLHRRLQTDSSDEEDDTSQLLQPAKVCRTIRISWTTARTERLLDWLEENPVDRHKLFSDSTKDAKDEGRRKRVAKGTKSEFHKLIAIFVFSVDADKDIRDD